MLPIENYLPYLHVTLFLRSAPVQDEAGNRLGVGQQLGKVSGLVVAVGLFELAGAVDDGGDVVVAKPAAVRDRRRHRHLREGAVDGLVSGLQLLHCRGVFV